MTGWGAGRAAGAARRARHRPPGADGALHGGPGRGTPGAADEPARRLRRRGMMLALGVVAALYAVRGGALRPGGRRGPSRTAAVPATQDPPLRGIGLRQDPRVNLLDGAPFGDTYECAERAAISRWARWSRQFYAELVRHRLPAFFRRRRDAPEDALDRDDPANWPALRAAWARPPAPVPATSGRRCWPARTPAVRAGARLGRGAGASPAPRAREARGAGRRHPARPAPRFSATPIDVRPGRRRRASSHRRGAPAAPGSTPAGSPALRDAPA
ncbi:hypothetical protein V2I01_40495 [Micromonospora sp. BRA006-A]|nr:hypothetical protein [Micromonospora sp. BRA006-A]